MLLEPCSYNNQYVRATAMLGGAIVAMTPLKSALPLPASVHFAVGGMAGEAFCNWRAGQALSMDAGKYLTAAVFGIAGGALALGQNPVTAVTDVAMEAKKATVG